MKKIITALIAVLFATNVYAAADKLTIVTSFPKDLTEKFKTAFEKKNPGVKVEILGKSTNAGIKYVQEIKANNSADLFWASAPDAFEVLKGDKLLTKYTSSIKGIPAKVGSYPITLKYGTPHGIACSFTLPVVLKSMIGHDKDCDMIFMNLFGNDFHKGPEILKSFLESIDISIDPKSYVGNANDWDLIVSDAFEGERGKNFIGSLDNLRKAQELMGL